MKTQSSHFSNIFFRYIFILSWAVLEAQSPINLNTISGLKLWINGDSIKTTNYPYIDTCFSLSSNHNHAIQTDTFYRPKVSSETLNGHPTIHFDGINDYISFTNISDVRTVYLVLRANAGMFGYNPILGSSTDLDFVGEDSMIISNAFANNVVKSGITKLNFTQVNPTITIRPKKYSILSIETTGNAIADNFSRDRGYAFRVWDGNLAELIIFNRVLSSTEISLVENYLIEKYSPKINLGPDISISPTTSCSPTNSVNIIANPDFINYLWSNGNTTNQINVSQYSEYSVIATDLFGVNHYDTIKVIPTPKNFNYPNSILCANSTILWDTQLNKTAHVFNWQDNSTDSVMIITQPGKYYVKITDAYGCSLTSDTVNVQLDNLPLLMSLGNDLAICSGNSIGLINASPAITSYSWSTGATTPSITITNSGQYSVIVTNTNNCVAKDTIDITIVGQAPTPNFLTTIGCKNNAVLFTDMSSFPVGNFITNTLWNFGDTPSSSNTSTLSNPYHTFSDTGNYNVSLTITLNTGCQQTITKPVHIAPKPLVSFIDGIACKNDSTLFTQTINKYGYPTISYAWNFGDPLSGINNTSLLPNPKHLFSQATNYTIKLIATNSVGCKDSISNTITVKAQVSASFTNSPLCTNIPVTFQDNSIVPTPNFQHIRLWNFGTGNVSGLSVSKIFTTPGVYSVSLTVNGFNGCISKTSKQFTITTPPISNFSVTNSCLNTPISITESSSFNANYPISSWSWKINNAPFSNAQLPTLANQNVGSYAIKLITTNTAGCKDSITKNLTVFPLPTVDFTSSPNINTYVNQPITFTPNNLTAIDYNWIVNTTNYNTPTLSFTPTSTGQYTINLTLKDTNGCVGNKTKQITITDYYLDLGILNINSTLNSNGFMEIDADIANFGTIPIYSFDINAQISNAATISETYTTTLNPNNLIRYRFNSKILANNSDLNNRICINVSSTSPIINDKNPNNNNLCIALSTTKPLINEPYPNPFNQLITLPIVLNQDTEISYEIINTLGETIISTTKQNGIEGLNLLSINTDSFSKGCYLLKITIDEKTYLKKIVKANNN